MPDKEAMLTAMAVSAAIAAFVLLLFAWSWRPPHPVRLGIGGALGTGLAITVGCWLLQSKPRWSLAEDQDRYLALLVPAAVLVECVAAYRKVPCWLAWGLRILLAAVAARVLLHHSIYIPEIPESSSPEGGESGLSIPDLNGHNPGAWQPGYMVLALGAMAVLLAVVWALLGLLVRRSPGYSVPLALSGVCGGSAVAIMFSGYLSGGELGLPLAAALAGASLASVTLSPKQTLAAPVGVGIVGLFGLLVLGRFFGFLTTTHGLVLFLAPVLCWVPELPYVVKLWPSLRGVLRVVLVAIPVVVVVLQAKEQHELDTATTAAESGGYSPDDYMNFGK